MSESKREECAFDDVRAALDRGAYAELPDAARGIEADAGWAGEARALAQRTSQLDPIELAIGLGTFALVVVAYVMSR